MKMKKFINEPENLTEELLEGLAMANGEYLQVEENHMVINRKLDEADRVTIVTMGGSGHEPVSYTHLDVYKRQVYQDTTRLRRKPCRPARVKAFHLFCLRRGLLLLLYK